MFVKMLRAGLAILFVVSALHAFELGLEAGAQFDKSDVPLVASSGARRVRLNFISRPEWNGTSDERFFATFDPIVDAYRAAGVKVAL
jgi:hypothetical protein